MKKLFLFATLVLVLALGASTIAAQGQDGTAAPGVWGSAINLQNVGTDTATTTIQFYNADGSLEYTYTPDPLAVDGSLSIYVPGVVKALASGQYSVVVSSDQPVLATVNTGSTNSTSAPWTAYSYEGFDQSQAATTLYFPGNYNNYYNIYSEIVLQNTGTSAATITGQFLKADGTVIEAALDMGTIQPNASQVYPMTSLLPAQSGNANGIFGAVITSSSPVVGVVNHWRSTPASGTASYSAYTSGSAELYAPSLSNNYYGFGSALTIQNVGTGNAAGTITYSDGTVDTFDLAEGAARSYYQPANAALPSGNVNGVFGAKVVATSGEVVGLVSASIMNGSKGDYASYNAPSVAASSVSIPSVTSDYYGLFSAVTVQNTDDALATDVTITYADGSFRTFTGVAAGDVVNILHLNNTGDILANRTATSAVVTSSNGVNLVAVIQQNTASNVAGYDASKVPSDFLSAVTGVTE
jgi:hypothetical protein